MDEVIHRSKSKKSCGTAASRKKKKDLRKFKASVQDIRAKMKKKSFKILNKHLEILIRWKKYKCDARLSSHNKDDLLV